MPRINAPTVAEHRAKQLRNLMHAARDLVAEEGPEALTLGALAKRVGVSRSSVYEYFRSRDDLAAAIIEDALPRWVAEIDEQLAGQRTTHDKVAAYVKHQLRMLTDGQHTAAVALSTHSLGEEVRERIRQEHDRLLEPLVRALDDAGVPEPGLRSRLIQGIVNAAAAQLEPGDDEHNTSVAEIASAQAIHGLALHRGPIAG
ncbi:helix-turn-helix domain containing protein [Saccharopolyspora sp. WRP15-2]|uniref:Helix-turn-helix domain containing protein n=1 Tax=Saccharopolyspora oryzae TaxID=2997343 RepID=A0ABT4UWU4_9PSEU|nr:TetR/AcrR family transcriptional regulator [Saccharopolyspora oryzae]MDA3626183.1 helix-turn-helix domain containing protein [Saccharopolyspora oryzae]